MFGTNVFEFMLLYGEERHESCDHVLKVFSILWSFNLSVLQRRLIHELEHQMCVRVTNHLHGTLLLL